MDRILLLSHSYLRFLVLLVGVVVVVYALYALLTKKPFTSGGRAMGSAFVGLMDLQILLGLASITVRWYPALIGHLSMMLLAAVVAHVLLVVNKRKATPTWLMLLLAVGIALLLVFGGIFAIPGRTPFTVHAA